MLEHETRRCPKCGILLRMVEGSDRTTPDRVWFKLRCRSCGHEEMDWHPRRKSKRSE